MNGKDKKGELKLIRGGLEEEYIKQESLGLHCYSCGAPMSDGVEHISPKLFKCSYCGRDYRIQHK